MNYQNEQQEWDNFIIKEIGDKAELISVSVTSSDNRVYLDENSICHPLRICRACVSLLNLEVFPACYIKFGV